MKRTHEYEEAMGEQMPLQDDLEAYAKSVCKVETLPFPGESVSPISLQQIVDLDHHIFQHVWPPEMNPLFHDEGELGVAFFHNYAQANLVCIRNDDQKTAKRLLDEVWKMPAGVAKAQLMAVLMMAYVTERYKHLVLDGRHEPQLPEIKVRPVLSEAQRFLEALDRFLNYCEHRNVSDELPEASAWMCRDGEVSDNQLSELKHRLRSDIFIVAYNAVRWEQYHDRFIPMNRDPSSHANIVHRCCGLTVAILRRGWRKRGSVQEARRLFQVLGINLSEHAVRQGRRRVKIP